MTTATAPSTKQLDFITRLINEKNTTGLDINLDTLTRKTASALIGTLMDRPAAGEDLPAAPAIDTDEHATRVATLLANLPEPMVYVQPLPGRKGDEMTTEDCSRCGGGGLYANAPGARIPGLPSWDNGKGDNAWCFKCNGTGTQQVKVSTVRGRESRRVREHNADIIRQRETAAETITAQLAAEAREAAEKAAAHDVHAAGHAAALALAESLPVGTKLTGTPVTVTRINTFQKEDPYSYTGGMITVRIITFTGGQGEQFVWFSESAAAYALSTGDTGNLHATIKNHSHFKGDAQATITRARLKNIIPAEVDEEDDLAA